MDGSRLDPDAQLERSLRRIHRALWYGPNPYAALAEQIAAETRAEVAERVATRMVERHRRRVERWRRRAEEREARRVSPWRYDPSDVPKGIVFTVAALVCLALAVAEPELWWMVFVGSGFGMSAAALFGRSTRSRRAEREARAGAGESQPAAERPAAPDKVDEKQPASPAEPPDPRVTRIQNLCDKILAELESGPPIVRDVMTQPQATIGGLRQACLEIARRERELRKVLASQDEKELLAERDGLVTRLANEHDEIVRDRLEQARRALAEQLEHRAELATAATRLEAENTRILYTLENLHMQMLRARSTDIGAPELGGKLRESLRELGTEIDAVAEALECASAPATATPAGTATATTTVPPGPSDTTAAQADAERAERQTAARRAQQARDAQR